MENKKGPRLCQITRPFAICWWLERPPRPRSNVNKCQMLVSTSLNTPSGRLAKAKARAPEASVTRARWRLKYTLSAVDLKARIRGPAINLVNARNDRKRPGQPELSPFSPRHAADPRDFSFLFSCSRRTKSARKESG